MKYALLSATTALALLPAAQAADTLLPEMTIEASRLDKASSTLTQSASVVEAEDIARGGYTDVTEILRSLAGIEFKQVGGPGQYNYLKMRGFGAGHVLVVVDGVTLNQAGSGDVGNLLSQLDPASISRIEVLRGPQAVLYGANATAGVISITTKRGGAPRLSVGAEAGSLGWQKLKASWQHAVELGPGQLRTSVHASRVDSDGVHKYEGFKDETFQFAADYSTEQIDAGMTVRDAIKKIGLEPEAVLAVSDGKLITDDTVLREGMQIKLVAVVSGGAPSARSGSERESRARVGP